MKKAVLYGLISWLGLMGCHRSVNVATAYNVAGSYPLIEYHNLTTTDMNPDGTVEVIQVDDQHVNLTIKGTSGKIKINYSYPNILVVDAGNKNAAGQDSYSLFYKGRILGLASNDGLARYLEVDPSSSIMLKAADF